MEIGQILRENREQKQLTLEDIQELTKIQKRYLQAIEDNEFEKLPGRFYARAFVKEYALVLELEPDVLLQYFDEDEDLQEEETTQYSNLRRTRRDRTPKTSSILSFLPTVIVIVLIIAILFVAWTLTQKALTSSKDPTLSPEDDTNEVIRDEEGARDRDEGVTETDEDEEDAEDEEADSESENEEDHSYFELINVEEGTSPQTNLRFIRGDTDPVLTFDLSGESYVSITGASGTIYFDGILNEETDVEPFDLSSEDSVYLNIGNTSVVVVNINDTSYEYEIEPSDYVHQKLQIEFQ